MKIKFTITLSKRTLKGFEIEGFTNATEIVNELKDVLKGRLEGAAETADENNEEEDDV